jgi:putative intracellular protease/amidase
MKTRFLGLTVLICTLVVGQSLVAESKGKVLMILHRTSDPTMELSRLTDMMLTKEVAVMKSALSEAGFEVVVATASGELVKGSAESLQPDLKLVDVRVGDYVGVIVPCMATDDPPDSESIDIVKQAWGLGIPLAAQNSGVFTLDYAGVLKGKHFAVQTDIAKWITDGTFAGIGVVVDVNVVTSGTCPYKAQQRSKPDGTAELTQKFIALIR